MLPVSFSKKYIPIKIRLQHLFFASCLIYFAYVKSVITGFLRLKDKQSQNSQLQAFKNTGNKIEVQAASFSCIFSYNTPDIFAERLPL